MADEADGLDALAKALKALAHPKRLQLLSFLESPHYLEEIASELKVARQSAQEHVQKLEDAKLLERVQGRRDHGPVTDFVVVPHRLFDLHERFGGRIGILQPDLDEDQQRFHRTTPMDRSGATPGGDAAVPRIILVHGMRVGRTIPLSGDGPWAIGRDPQGELCLDYDPYVSTRHAEIERVEGGFALLDGLSRNGTYVDFRRLDRGERVDLMNGALVRIGKTLLLFRSPGR